MKKVYEFSVSETTIEIYDDFDGLVDHVIDPFDGEPLNLQDNAVKLEKGQEAIFKVTVTTTVELIDVRMAETWSKEEVAAVDAKAKEIEPLFHADGCGFFYGNPCECGFELKEALATPIPPGPVCSCYIRTINATAHPSLHALSCPVFGVYALSIPTTQTPPKLEWACNTCGRREPSGLTSPAREVLSCPVHACMGKFYNVPVGTVLPPRTT